MDASFVRDVLQIFVSNFVGVGGQGASERMSQLLAILPAMQCCYGNYPAFWTLDPKLVGGPTVSGVPTMCR